MGTDKFEEDRLIFVNQIESFLQKKMLTEALGMAEARLAAYPMDADALVFINRILTESGKIEQSRDVLRKLEMDISRLSVVFLRAADTYRETGLNQDALLYYQKFIALNPLSDYSPQVAARIIEMEKEVVAPASSDEPDIPDMPRPEFYTITLAELYLKQGHLKMAADILSEIIARDPANVQARIKLDTIKTKLDLKKSSGETLPTSDNLITILSCWLENIDRLKKHAT